MFYRVGELLFDLATQLLRFDDFIDTVAMSSYLIHAKGRGEVKPPTKKTLTQEIKTNEPAAPGLPVLSGVNTSTLTPEQVNLILANKYDSYYTKENNAESRPRPNIIG